MIEMLKCREKKYNNKIKHFYSVAPKKIIWRLSFFLIGANGSLLDFFVWSPVVRDRSTSMQAMSPERLTQPKKNCN